MLSRPRHPPSALILAAVLATALPVPAAAGRKPPPPTPDQVLARARELAAEGNQASAASGFARAGCATRPDCRDELQAASTAVVQAHWDAVQPQMEPLTPDSAVRGLVGVLDWGKEHRADPALLERLDEVLADAFVAALPGPDQPLATRIAETTQLHRHLKYVALDSSARKRVGETLLDLAEEARPTHPFVAWGVEQRAAKMGTFRIPKELPTPAPLRFRLVGNSCPGIEEGLIYELGKTTHGIEVTVELQATTCDISSWEGTELEDVAGTTKVARTESVATQTMTTNCRSTVGTDSAGRLKSDWVRVTCDEVPTARLSYTVNEDVTTKERLEVTTRHHRAHVAGQLVVGTSVAQAAIPFDVHELREDKQHAAGAYVEARSFDPTITGPGTSNEAGRRIAQQLLRSEGEIQAALRTSVPVERFDGGGVPALDRLENALIRLVLDTRDLDAVSSPEIQFHLGTQPRWVVQVVHDFPGTYCAFNPFNGLGKMCAAP